MFNVSELHLESGLQDTHLIVVKPATVGYLCVGGTHTPDHILVDVEVVADGPVAQVTAPDVCLSVGERRVVVLQTDVHITGIGVAIPPSTMFGA